jgi:hypothetical protein
MLATKRRYFVTELQVVTEGRALVRKRAPVMRILKHKNGRFVKVFNGCWVRPETAGQFWPMQRKVQEL